MLAALLAAPPWREACKSPLLLNWGDHQPTHHIYIQALSMACALRATQHQLPWHCPTGSSKCSASCCRAAGSRHVHASSVSTPSSNRPPPLILLQHQHSCLYDSSARSSLTSSKVRLRTATVL